MERISGDEGDARANRAPIDWHAYDAPSPRFTGTHVIDEFPLERLGRYRYTVSAWVDHFLSWLNEFKRRVEPADIADLVCFLWREKERTGGNHPSWTV